MIIIKDTKKIINEEVKESVENKNTAIEVM